MPWLSGQPACSGGRAASAGTSSSPELHPTTPREARVRRGRRRAEGFRVSASCGRTTPAWACSVATLFLPHPVREARAGPMGTSFCDHLGRPCSHGLAWMVCPVACHVNRHHVAGACCRGRIQALNNSRCSTNIWTCGKPLGRVGRSNTTAQVQARCFSSERGTWDRALRRTGPVCCAGRVNPELVPTSPTAREEDGCVSSASAWRLCSGGGGEGAAAPPPQLSSQSRLGP